MTHKCDICGKLFETNQQLTNHKNRKRPCILPKPAGDQPLVNHCIHCNRIFVQRSSLNRHLKLCKVKAGDNLANLDPIARLEQAVNVLVEKDAIRETEHLDMKKTVTTLHKDITHVKKTVGEPRFIPDGKTDKINSYKHPNVSYIDFQSLILNRRVLSALELIKQLWFHPDHPENHSIFRVNKTTNDIMIYNNDDWSREPLSEIVTEIRTQSIQMILKSMETIRDDYTRQIIYNIKPIMRSRLEDPEGIKEDNEQIFNYLLDNRNIVQETIKKVYGVNITDI